jgi:flavorubredoxin
MRAVVVYESMYGNTHLIAEATGSQVARWGSQ